MKYYDIYVETEPGKGHSAFIAINLKDEELSLDKDSLDQVLINFAFYGNSARKACKRVTEITEDQFVDFISGKCEVKRLPESALPKQPYEDGITFCNVNIGGDDYLIQLPGEFDAKAAIKEALHQYQARGLVVWGCLNSKIRVTETGYLSKSTVEKLEPVIQAKEKWEQARTKYIREVDGSLFDADFFSFTKDRNQIHSVEEAVEAFRVSYYLSDSILSDYLTFVKDYIAEYGFPKTDKAFHQLEAAVNHQLEVAVDDESMKDEWREVRISLSSEDEQFLSCHYAIESGDEAATVDIYPDGSCDIEYKAWSECSRSTSRIYQEVMAEGWQPGYIEEEQDKLKEIESLVNEVFYNLEKGDLDENLPSFHLSYSVNEKEGYACTISYFSSLDLFKIKVLLATVPELSPEIKERSLRMIQEYESLEIPEVFIESYGYDHDYYMEKKQNVIDALKDLVSICETIEKDHILPEVPCLPIGEEMDKMCELVDEWIEYELTCPVQGEDPEEDHDDL